MQKDFTFVQVRINRGRPEGSGVGGNHGQDNDVPCGCNGLLHSFLYELICINSKWLNRVEGRSSVGSGVGGNHGQDNDVPCGCKGLLHSFK